MTESQSGAEGFRDTEVIVLNAQGLWLADGTEISHEPTRRLFARSLRRDTEGYFLSIGRETKRITVEDTAYFVRRTDGNPEQGFELSLNDDTQEKLDPATLTYRPGRLTCRIKGSSETAKFLSPAYFDLLKHLGEDARSYYLVIEGARVTLAGK